MVINRMQWKIGGSAGEGIMTTGMIFSKVCARAGLKTCAYPEYPSLIRGGHNTYQIFVNDKHATSQLRDVHLLVALNKESIALHIDELIDGSAVIYDPDDWGDETPSVEGKDVIMVPVEMTKFAKEHEVDKVARNTVALGASFGMLGLSLENLEGVIQDWFGKKKPELVDENMEQAEAGYEAVAGKYEQFGYRLERKKGKPQTVISGNAAIAIGAIKAGMKFFAAYPMTPSSDILSYLAKKEKDYNLVVKQTEDELAAMNMIIGAGFAGVRSMTATSGGGFALMTEALGMAGIAETPCVVVMGQRPGPSTGLPTWGGQGDLNQVLGASQGEFPRIVLAPGDPKECFYLTHEAFNLAEKYQAPVVILVDKYNQQTWLSMPHFKTSNLKLERGKMMAQKDLDKIIGAGSEYLRYKHTDDGISPRTLPGMANGRHVASSYEHFENGHTTESEEETVKQYDKRFKKMETFVENDAEGPKYYGTEDALVTVVGWGSTKLPAIEMLRLAEEEDVPVNYLHFTYIDPLPKEKVFEAFAHTHKTLCVEGNKLGQLENWLKQQADITMNGNFHKYGGRPFYPEEMLEKVKEML
ncbi:MAG: 2-oxoacid:acceptor oxidoreductase subunit alpha [Candidatus Kerfeldbacteria bacterium]